MSRAQRQDDKRATVAVGELCFARTTRVAVTTVPI
jgi:hypothetical protein